MFKPGVAAEVIDVGKDLPVCSSAAVLGLLAVRYFLFDTQAAKNIGDMGSAPNVSFKFEAVTGFFMQDELSTDPVTFDYVRCRALQTLMEDSLAA